MNWLDIKRVQPSEDEFCIVTDGNDFNIQRYERIGKNKYRFVESEGNELDYEVTHWMRVPALPKEQKKEEKPYSCQFVYKPPEEIQGSELYNELMWNDPVSGYIAFDVKYLKNNAHHSYEYIRYFSSKEQLKTCNEYKISHALDNFEVNGANQKINPDFVKKCCGIDENALGKL